MCPSSVLRGERLTNPALLLTVDLSVMLLGEYTVAPIVVVPRALARLMNPGSFMWCVLRHCSLRLYSDGDTMLLGTGGSDVTRLDPDIIDRLVNML